MISRERPGFRGASLFAARLSRAAPPAPLGLRRRVGLPAAPWSAQAALPAPRLNSPPAAWPLALLPRWPLMYRPTLCWDAAAGSASAPAGWAQLSPVLSSGVHSQSADQAARCAAAWAPPSTRRVHPQSADWADWACSAEERGR